ncbi:hypothetical protein [Marinobacter sp. CHS3-4]|uniref:hypothetical protein n=1 Tax=Marinobacter sp. CHS3-4 TaxID=3045174 RepID=UPI0024B61F99|nr:hypothetical protein [Marinobacter sp. CHS3-4]MDI9245953.1 hypothetical protein [Marinobacter sp. CHS3-4]
MQWNHLNRILAASLLVFSAQVAADCDYLDATPQPDWVTQPKAPEGFYTGIGSVRIEDDDFAGSVPIAKQQAISDLAASIKVRVQNQLTITEAMNSSGESTRDMESLSTLTVDNTLEFVEVDEIWLDREECILWARVKVTEESVTKQKEATYAQQLYTEFDTALDNTDNPNLSFSDRQDSLNTATDLLKQIAFDALPKVQASTAQSQLQAAQDRMNQLAQTFSEGKALLENLRQAKLNYNNAKSSDARAEAAMNAKQIGMRIQQIAPINQQLGLAEQALFELADIDLASNNNCAALTRLQTITNSSQNDAYRSQAEEQLSSLECSAEGRRQAAVRNTIEAQNIRLWCGSQTGGQLQYWAKACDKMREWVNEFGGVVVSSKKVTPEQLDSLDSFEGKDGALDFIVYAGGEVQSRDNPSNPNGKDYRFSGDVTQSAHNPNTTLMIDRFNGMTGWNPVGEAFALDLLAINLVKRFEVKLGGALTP